MPNDNDVAVVVVPAMRRSPTRTLSALLERYGRGEAFPTTPMPDELRTLVVGNNAFRRVLYTPRARRALDRDAGVPRVQHVAMTLEPGTAIGWEMHASTVQIFVVLSGEALFYRGRPYDRNDTQRANSLYVRVRTGDSWVVEQGTWHDVEVPDDVRVPLRLLTYYVPPLHAEAHVDEVRPPADDDDA
jgi:mannose-6-phosphate isomerase-like protein (cupin superfamily)